MKSCNEYDLQLLRLPMAATFTCRAEWADQIRSLNRVRTSNVVFNEGPPTTEFSLQPGGLGQETAETV